MSTCIFNSKSNTDEQSSSITVGANSVSPQNCTYPNAQSSSLPKSRAYIFDLDGTLLDSMDVWERIDIEFLEKRNIAIPPDYIPTVLSMTFPESAAYTIHRFCLTDSVEELLQEWNRMAIHAYANTVPLKPYAKEYLTSLRERGAKLAIATSLPAQLYEPALHAHGIYGMFDAISSTDEVSRGKTYPDVFLLTAQKLGEEPANCIVFEDILAAIKSAKSIGMTVYGVYDKSSEADWAEIEKTADGVICNFKNLYI